MAKDYDSKYSWVRMGGKVGEGAYVDLAFDTVDVLLILDVAEISPRQREMYTKGLSG
jgi:putative hemolysin